jgi:hypothetical protein
MRCYFMRDGHIAAVEVMEDVKDDAEAVKRASALFVARVGEGRFDGFEVWERARRVFIYPLEPSSSTPGGNGQGNGNGNPQKSKKREAKGASLLPPSLIGGLVPAPS